MRKKYDDFTQLKPKDMSKAISDMTYEYINPDTKQPTFVPSNHYEKILDQITEKYMADITTRQFLVIMFNQLSALKKEDEKYFNQALICLDMGINPKDMRIPDQIALNYTYDTMDEMQKDLKKDFHFLNDELVDTYDRAKNDPTIQSTAVRFSNELKYGDNNHHKERGDDYER